MAEESNYSRTEPASELRHCEPMERGNPVTSAIALVLPVLPDRIAYDLNFPATAFFPVQSNKLVRRDGSGAASGHGFASIRLPVSRTSGHVHA